MLDERAEILINRKLDGELSDDESLELDKLLIRDPGLRAMLEDCGRMDALAGEVIRTAVDAPGRRAEPARFSTWVGTVRQWWRSFGMVSAVAAAVTLAFLLSQRVTPIQVRRPAAGMATVSPNTVGRSEGLMNADYPADMEGPRRETKTLERDVIGVWDQQTRSLYLLEITRDRSLVEALRENY
jgi:hypothetical protein